MNRQTGGVVLAFAGFVFLVGAFRGTWQATIDALLGHTPTTGGSSGGRVPTAQAGSGMPGTSVIPGSSGNPLASAGR